MLSTRSSEMWNKWVPIIVLFVAVSVVATPAAVAAPNAQEMTVCAQDHTVMAGDELNMLAGQYLGDAAAYQRIVDATNATAAEDSSYATISNPRVIEIGWKLCIPATDGDAAMKEDMAMMEGEMTGFKVRIENIAGFEHSASGVFNTPKGNMEPGPLLPGGVYEFNFSAQPGERVSFASMFVHSNDLFIGPGKDGISLFDADGNPLSGDVTDQISLWDAGTEMNQEPGTGADQAPRQAGPDSGAVDPDDMVRLAGNEFGNLPAVEDTVKIMLDSNPDNQFVLSIENVSGDDTLMTGSGEALAALYAPGAWVVHSGDNPLLIEGQPDPGHGVEALAEDGNPANLADYLAAQSGVVSPLAPGVWVVHTSSDPLFIAGEADRGEGLEPLSEDGNPAVFVEMIAKRDGVSASGVFNTPAGATEPGPLLPGHAYEFDIEAKPGDRLSFATMFVQSNDLFYAPDGNGIELIAPDGMAATGDVTGQILLWDAGTEVNQQPGVGPDQAPRQAGPDTGADEMGVVQVVSDMYGYPSTIHAIRVTLSPAEPMM